MTHPFQGEAIEGASLLFDDTLTGTRFDDRIDGTDHADLIQGLAGDDVIQGLSGDDQIEGGRGDDTLLGGSGDDTLDGGTGADSMSGGSGDDVIYVDHVGKPEIGRLTPLPDVIDGGSGFDVVSFERCDRGININLFSNDGATGGLINVEHVIGTDFDDQIVGSVASRGEYDGGDGNDYIEAIHALDTVEGGAGDDTLFAGGALQHQLFHGGDGDDLIDADGFHSTIDGGAGDDILETDILNGLPGHNLLTGGAGADVFQFFGNAAVQAAEITDLEAQDKIDLSGIDADGNFNDGDQAFTLVGHLDGHAGEAALRYDATKDVTSLLLDTDGDGHANMTIQLDGDHTDFTNFVL